jgi:hypothetical protein
MTRVSSNIVHPRAWIHTQFAIANIASAILVSSNPTNLVLAGAFEIKFINYTANMIVPVVATAVVLFPFLLYIVFANPALIPYSIQMHELPAEALDKKPVNPNIPHARGQMEEEENNMPSAEQTKILSLEEIMNPFLDKGGAAFGAVIMAATLITVLVLNAVSAGTEAHPVFWVTLPGAFVMFCWDVGFGWYHREETRQIARRGRLELENARAERALRDGGQELSFEMNAADAGAQTYERKERPSESSQVGNDTSGGNLMMPSPPAILVSENTDGTAIASSSSSESVASLPTPLGLDVEKPTIQDEKSTVYQNPRLDRMASETQTPGLFSTQSGAEGDDEKRVSQDLPFQKESGPTTLVSLAKDGFRWCQETFPTAAAVILHLPFALVPFAFSMFVLVQALVTKGWIPVFAYGWDHWVRKTGTVGAIGGMGFLSVVLCNVRSPLP